MNYLTVRRPNNGVSTRNDFDRLFESVFGNMPSWNDRSPAVDIRQNDNEYVIEADLPGMTEDQIDVRVENDLLVISATADEQKTVDEKKTADETNGTEQKGENSDEFIVRERRTRSFYRSFSMPKDADAGQIDATYRNGVLTVQLHKKPESKPRQIEIKRG
ncbi:MAG: Hsp20/alpha crystallin family protein [Alkalispirochaeta sp.]